jgi:hypothetical protein
VVCWQITVVVIGVGGIVVLGWVRMVM